MADRTNPATPSAPHPVPDPAPGQFDYPPPLPPDGPYPAALNHNLASEFRFRLSMMIREFEASLDDEHEVGVQLVNFGHTFTFHLTEIGFWNPSLISFTGKTDSGDTVNLIQHVSQISILLMKMKRVNKEAPKRAIGFHSDPPASALETPAPMKPLLVPPPPQQPSSNASTNSA